MSYILDVYYDRPEDAAREVRISEIAAQHGGRLYSKETEMSEGSEDGPTTVWLRLEFEDFDAVTVAQKHFLKIGEWAEPPSDIGD